VTMLATIWEPGLNPIGPASMFALGTTALAWVLADWVALSRVRTVIILLSLGLFSVFLVVSAANLVALEPLHLGIKRRRFPDFDDYLANYILLAVGTVLGLKLIRRPMGWVRDIGIVLTFVWCGVIVAEACGTIYWSCGGS